MSFKSIQIEHFKGFGTENNTIEFAIPKGQRYGSGLTIIVGPNNSGKSTVIEAIQKYAFESSTFLMNEEYTGSDFPIITFADDVGNTAILTKEMQTSSANRDVENLSFRGKFKIILVHQHWEDTFQEHSENYVNYKNTLHLYGTTNKFDADKMLGPLIAASLRNAEQRERLNSFLKRIFPNYNLIYANQERENVPFRLYYKTGDGGQHPVSRVGMGMFKVFKTLIHLVNHDHGDILVIDEPETSLHPQSQKVFAEILFEQSQDQQIIICTHSPYFINWEVIKNGAQIVRLTKHQDKYCYAYALDNFSKYESLLKALNDYRKPFLLDTVAKEAFFAINILFVEGQEDQSLLNKFIIDQEIAVNFEIFGYGSNGAQNIYGFLTFAKDLGLNAAALFDGDQQAEFERCERDFPDFLIDKLETDDIRDKYKQEIRNQRCVDTDELLKEGLFNKNGEVKTNKEAHLKDLLNKINQYFNNK